MLVVGSIIGLFTLIKVSVVGGNGDLCVTIPLIYC
jgi:hypothetical protein